MSLIVWEQFLTFVSFFWPVLAGIAVACAGVGVVYLAYLGAQMALEMLYEGEDVHNL